MKEKMRNYLMDNFKALLIIFVVIGHVIEPYIEGNYIVKGIYAFIYLFHMEAFIFISGYFTKNLEKSNKNAIKNYFFPFFFFNLLACLFHSFINGKINISWTNPAWTLWYLVIIFSYKLLLKYIVKIPYYFPLSVILSLLVSTVDSINNNLFYRFFAYLPFFLLGYFVQQKDIEKIRKQFSTVFSIIILVFIFCIIVYFMKEKIFKMALLYNKNSYHFYETSHYIGILIRIINYITSIIMTICFLCIIPDKMNKFSQVGQNSGSIFVSHSYFITLFHLIIPTWPKDFLQQIFIVINIFVIFKLSYNRYVIAIYQYLNHLWMKMYCKVTDLYHYILK